MNRKKKKRNALSVIRTVAFAALLISAGYAAFWFFGSRSHQKESEDTVNRYVKILSREEGESGGESTPEGSGSGELHMGVKSDDVEIDFESLQKINGDVVAWIRMPDIYCVDYPVVWRTDEYYLERSWKGERSTYGSIFIEEGNKPDFTDYHTILYGHSMMDRTMFGWIDNYLIQDYYDTHRDLIFIYTPKGRLTYQIFAVEEINHSDPDVYTVGFVPSPMFEEFVNGMLERNRVNTGVDATVNDRVLTLSTCAYDGKDRLAVHAKLVDGYLMEENG